MRRFYFAFALITYTSCVFAQGNIAVEGSFMAGKVLKHSTKFRPPIPELSTAFNLSFIKQTTGTNDWEQLRHYPIWGLGLTYTHYGIDSVYGSSIGLCLFAQKYIIRGKRLEWTVSGGLGLGYATRHYERAPVWDTLNNAIGSAANNYTLMQTDIRYRINANWSIQAGLNFSHLSNGALKQPNLGVNMYGGHIGLRYWPAGDRPKLITRERPKLRNRILAQARLSMAFNESGNADGPIYPVYMASAYASMRYKSRNKVFLGIDYSYHTRIYAFQRNNEINVGNERANSWKSAVFLGHEWLFGRIGVVAQVGVYVKEAVLRLDPYYEKIGYNLYLLHTEHGALKELCVSMLLKTHQSVAELVECGIGVGF
jgi:hypothetical protein